MKASLIFFIIESKKVPDVIKEKKNNNSFSEKNKKIGIKINNSFNKSRSKFNNNLKINGILTTTDRKELLQLSECTFKPTINTTNNNSFRLTNPNSNRKMTFFKICIFAAFIIFNYKKASFTFFTFVCVFIKNVSA